MYGRIHTSPGSRLPLAPSSVLRSLWVTGPLISCYQQPAVQLWSTARSSFPSEDLFCSASSESSTESPSPREVRAVCKAEDSSLITLLLFSGPFSPLFYCFSPWEGRQRLLTGPGVHGGDFSQCFCSLKGMCVPVDAEQGCRRSGGSEPDCWDLTGASSAQWQGGPTSRGGGGGGPVQKRTVTVGPAQLLIRHREGWQSPAARA